MKANFRCITGQTHDLWNSGDDINHACCLCCSQSCLFDPSAAVFSSLKWIGVSMLIFWITTVLWPAVLVLQLSIYFKHGLCAYAVSFNISTQQSRFSRLGQPKVELNDPTDTEMSVLGSTSVLHWSGSQKTKSSHQPYAGFILVSLLPKGTLSVHQLFYNQFLPDPTWANFPLDPIYAGTHLCVCVCVGQHVSCMFIWDRNNEFMRSSINLSLKG